MEHKNHNPSAENSEERQKNGDTLASSDRIDLAAESGTERDQKNKPDENKD